MRNKIRKAKDKGLLLISFLFALFGVIMLFAILFTIFTTALPSLTPYFLFTPESQTPGLGQGIANAVVGSILLSLISTVLATPFALGTAIYLQKYAADNRFTRTLRFFIEVLSGTPSIVVGAFGLLVLVIYLRPYTGGFSLLAGSIGLAILILPVIERAIEDAIATVPNELEEGSYALGATKWQTIRDITIPTVISGITTGTILGFGRAAEESAVVILTAGYTQFLPEIGIKQSDKLFMGMKVYPFQDLVASLPYAVYHAYENSNVIPISNGFACAFILIAFVMLVNIGAKIGFYFVSNKTSNKKPLLRSLRIALSNPIGGFSSTKRVPCPVPAAACAAAEIAAAQQEADIRHKQSTGKPAPATVSPVRITPEIDWKETLLSGLLVNPRAPPAEAQSPVNQAGNTTTTPAGVSADPANRPVHDTIPLTITVDDTLYEDKNPLVSDRPEDHKNLEEGLSELEHAFRSELVRSLEHMDGPADPGEPASFHEEEISGKEWEPVLLEEDSGTILEEEPYPGIIEVPATESWRTMTRNRLENTISGITSFPQEEL